MIYIALIVADIGVMSETLIFYGETSVFLM